MKNSGSFHISAYSIICGYLFEPPRRGGYNEYPQSMFLSRNKKNNVYPCKPQFYCIKVGFKRVKTRRVFVMDSDLSVHSRCLIRIFTARIWPGCKVSLCGQGRLIRLRGRVGWFEYSLFAHDRRYVSLHCTICNISEDTREMPQLRRTAFPRHNKRERRGTNNDKTNVTYETIDAQRKKNYNRGTALERSAGKQLGGYSQFYSRETSPLSPGECSRLSCSKRR